MKSLTPQSLVNDLITEIFHLHAEVISTGNALTAPYGLTSARWQVMGTLEMTGPQTVAGLAKKMGLTRQSVQRVVTEMVTERLLCLRDNPADKRAKQVMMSSSGHKAYEAVSRDWLRLSGQLSDQFSTEQFASLIGQIHQLSKMFAGLDIAGK